MGIPKLLLHSRKANLIVAGSILLALGAIYRFSPDFRQESTSAVEIDLMKTRIVKLQKKVAKKDSLLKQVKQARLALKRAEEGLLKGETASIAAVELQKFVADVMKTADVAAGSVNVKKSVAIKDSHYLNIPVEYSVTSSIRQLVHVLYRIEAAAKILRISRFHAQVQGSSKDAPIKSMITVEGLTERRENP